MKRILILAIIALLALDATGLGLANHNPEHMNVTSSSVIVQSVTVVHPPDLALSPTEFRDIPTMQTITATGRQFLMMVTCSAFNTAGVGPDYRYQVGVTVDGAAVGEARFMHTPAYIGYYETGSSAGSLREGIDTSTPSTHTFKIQAWGIQGSLATQEINFTIVAYQ